MKAQKTYDEMIQFLIANYSYYSICPDGSRHDRYLEVQNTDDVAEGDSAA